MADQRIIPYPLRIKADLRAWLKQVAKKNRRSVNAELTVLIEKAKEKQELASNELA